MVPLRAAAATEVDAAVVAVVLRPAQPVPSTLLLSVVLLLLPTAELLRPLAASLLAPAAADVAEARDVDVAVLAVRLSKAIRPPLHLHSRGEP